MNPADPLPARQRRVALRHRWLAAAYDRLIADKLLYARARARAVELLELRPGATVLDVACGTASTTRSSSDGSAPTAASSASTPPPRCSSERGPRVRRNQWANVSLIQADASLLSRRSLEEAAALGPTDAIDAAICTLGLSVIPDWQQAWQKMLGTVKPGGRVAIMDSGSGDITAFRPVASLICRFYAADGQRAPWQLVARDTDNPTLDRFSWGYVWAATGTRPARTSVAPATCRPGARGWSPRPWSISPRRRCRWSSSPSDSATRPLPTPLPNSIGSWPTTSEWTGTDAHAVGDRCDVVSYQGEYGNVVNSCAVGNSISRARVPERGRWPPSGRA
jgi:S-adenosylmethionine-diacylgycerolhomoserine-N-methlytransferase